MAAMGYSSTGSGVPPGFRFHPTDEELLHFYLKKKVSFQKFDMEVIKEVDLNKVEPWELHEKCKIGTSPQNEWYFFSHKDKKYPTGSRTNRATGAGFWKATGRDKCIRNNFTKIGMRKTLVFYRGRAPHGQKTDWIMHEYRLEDYYDQNLVLPHPTPTPTPTEDDGWVVCRVFKKKNLLKVGNSSEVGAATPVAMMVINGGDNHLINNNNMKNTTYTAETTNHIAILNDHQYLLHPHRHAAAAAHQDQISSYSHQYPSYQENQYMSSTHDQHDHRINKPLLMLNDYNHHHPNLSTTTTTTATSTHHYHHHHHQSIPAIAMVSTSSSSSSSRIQVKQFISPSDDGTFQGFEIGGVEYCTQSTHPPPPPLLPTNHQQNQQWDDDNRLVITTSPNHHSTNPSISSNNQIAHLSVPSEMDFWAFAK